MTSFAFIFGVVALVVSSGARGKRGPRRVFFNARIYRLWSFSYTRVLRRDHVV